MFSIKRNTAAIIYFLLLINNFIFQEITAQIVGGSSTTIEELPFVVSLRHNNEHFCGGSIISVRHILTAAHCLIDRYRQISSLSVVTGSTMSYGNFGVHHGVRHFITHPGFLFRTLHNDIAVVTLSTNIAFGPSSQKINLPSRDVQGVERATISGWGYLSESHEVISNTLQRAHMTVMTNQACSERFGGERIAVLINGQMCAYERRGVGVCIKDSGGPLSVNNELIGIISNGIPCAHGFPDVFTRVFAYKNWIEHIMAAA